MSYKTQVNTVQPTISENELKCSDSEMFRVRITLEIEKRLC